MLIEKSAT